MTGRIRNTIRHFLNSESAGGIVLMIAAFLALLVANSPVAPTYFDALHAYLGPLSLQHWINDALMVVFFLLVIVIALIQLYFTRRKEVQQ